MRINLTKKEIVNAIYMQIGFSKKISENLLEDVLVSGSNVSGTNYSPPSSFISNKKYTR